MHCPLSPEYFLTSDIVLSIEDLLAAASGPIVSLTHQFHPTLSFLLHSPLHILIRYLVGADRVISLLQLLLPGLPRTKHIL